MITSLKQKEIKFKPRIKLNHNTYQSIQKEKTISCRLYVDQDQKMTAYLSELTAIIDSKKFSFHEMINLLHTDDNDMNSENFAYL